MEIAARPLEGRFVRLEPLAPTLKAEVGAALASEPDDWAIMVNNGGPGGFETWWAANLAGMAARERLVFAVRRRADGAVVGSTGFYSFRREHGGVEIGSTFYRPDARGGPVNPECKLLLLHHAFSAGAVRVEFVTDALNARSRAALARLGAVEEGLLRRHKITWTGRVRDTVVFSVIEADWPQVRAGLEARLATFAATPR